MRERRKEPREGSEIEPETVDLQAVTARACTGGGVPFVEWASELPYAARLRQMKCRSRRETESEQGDLVACGRPEAG